MTSTFSVRRKFLGGVAGLWAAGFARGEQTSSAPSAADEHPLPEYALQQYYTSLKQSSYDRSGGNSDRRPVAVGETKEVFDIAGPGIISHIWLTIAAPDAYHLKEIVLRIYWDGNPKPSVEVPVGDFFGPNLGIYNVYRSAFLNCSSVRSLNCYFSMPFRKSARITVTNEGTRDVGSFYSNIDYKLAPSLPSRTLYFRAQYRQKTPNPAVEHPAGAKELNLEGKENHVFMETKGTGHLMGVTLGVLQNAENWMGEGDEMVFVDDDSKPVITGTGSEDYFCGAWDFGGRDNSVPFAHLYNGAHYISSPERIGGRYSLYRWHADNPITFQRSLSILSSAVTPMTGRIAFTPRPIGIRRNPPPIFRRCLALLNVRRPSSSVRPTNYCPQLCQAF